MTDELLAKAQRMKLEIEAIQRTIASVEKAIEAGRTIDLKAQDNGSNHYIAMTTEEVQAVVTRKKKELARLLIDFRAL